MLRDPGAGVTGVSAVSTVSPCFSQSGARRSIRMAPSGAVKIMASTEMMSTLLANVKSLAMLTSRAKSKATGPRAAYQKREKRDADRVKERLQWRKRMEVIFGMPKFIYPYCS